jgi:hypothetical protein
MWASSSLQTINLFDQTALKEHTKGIVGIYAANLFNARLGHRLSVRNHGERLEGGCGHIGTTGSDPRQDSARLLRAARQLKLVPVGEQCDPAPRER